MRRLTCLLLALGASLAGLSLRALVPVTPVDEAFREVVRPYRIVPDTGSGAMR